MIGIQEKYIKQLSALNWENGFNPEMTKVERLAFFAELVTKKNASINLISRRDVESIIENHVFISAFITKYIPDKCSNFLDIGTGGGFPGIPLAIMRPEMNGVLVDSIKKKIDAVRDFVNKLKLGNVKVESDRVEGPEFIDRYSRHFDLVISRATVPLIILLRYSLPLLKERAFIAAMKGGNIEEEYKKAELKYKSCIKKSTIFELSYKPSNIRNHKEKKLILLEINK